MQGEGDNDQALPKPSTPREGSFPLPVEEEERAAREEAALNNEESRRVLEQQKHKLHERIDGLVKRGADHKLPLSALKPTPELAKQVLGLVPAMLALVGCAMLVGGADWVLGACVCGASAVLVAVVVVLNRPTSLVVLGALVVGSLGGTVLVAVGFNAPGGALLLSLVLYLKIRPNAGPGIVAAALLFCTVGVAGLLGLGEDNGGVVVLVVCTGFALLLCTVELGRWVRDSDLALRIEFNELQVEAGKQLDSVNLLVDQCKARVRKEPSMANVVSIASSGEGTHVSQRLPLWWFIAAPVRTLGIVVGGLVFAVPDGLRTVSADWSHHLTGSVLYNAFTRPWIALLVRGFRQDALAATPVLCSHLEFAQEHLGPGVEFISVPVKRSARAMVKVRDDYLCEQLPKLLHYTLGAVLSATFAPAKAAALGSSNALVRFVLVLGLLVPFTVVAGVLVLGVHFPLAIVERVLVAMVLFSWHAGSSTAKLVDMARATLVCNTPDDLRRVHDHLHEHEHHHDTWEVVRVKNSWADDSVKGYAHVMYNVRMRDTGVVCEVQVTIREVFEWRKFTHLPYVVLRADSWQALVQDAKGKEKHNNGA